MLEAKEGWRGGVAEGDLEPYCPSPDCGSAGAEVAVLKACRCPTQWSDCWACSGISRSHGAHFAVAEVLTCCWQEKEEEGDPGVPAPGGAGRGCKAHCCCSCCCWLQVDLLVTTGHVDVELFLPW